MSTRAKAASALASLGVLALGWQIGTANGQTVTVGPTTTSTATTRTATANSQVGTATDSGGTADSSATGSSDPGSSASDPTGQSSASTGSASSAGSASTGTASQQGGTASGLKDGTYTGATSTNRFGSVTVTITVAGGRVTDSSGDTQARDGHSQRINSSAVPVLDDEVVQAQGDQIDTVSGATYTSDSYLTSLQSALDQAAA